jgi:hypothetical protein
MVSSAAQICWSVRLNAVFYAKRAVFDTQHSALNTRNTLAGYLKGVSG